MKQTIQKINRRLKEFIYTIEAFDVVCGVGIVGVGAAILWVWR